MFQELMGNFMQSPQGQGAAQALMQKGYSPQDTQSILQSSVPAAADAMHQSTNGHPQPAQGLFGMLSSGLQSVMGGGGAGAGMMGGGMGAIAGMMAGAPGGMGGPPGAMGAPQQGGGGIGDFFGGGGQGPGGPGGAPDASGLPCEGMMGTMGGGPPGGGMMGGPPGGGMMGGPPGGGMMGAMQGGAVGMITGNIAQTLSQRGMHPNQAQDAASTVSGFIAQFAHQQLGAHPANTPR